MYVRAVNPKDGIAYLAVRDTHVQSFLTAKNVDVQFLKPFRDVVGRIAGSRMSADTRFEEKNCKAVWIPMARVSIKVRQNLKLFREPAGKFLLERT